MIGYRAETRPRTHLRGDIMTAAALPDALSSVLEDVTPPCDCTCDAPAEWALTFTLPCEHFLWLMCEPHAAAYQHAAGRGHWFMCARCLGRPGRLVKAVRI